MGCGSSDPLRTEAVSPWFIKVATIVKLDGGGRWEVGGGGILRNRASDTFILVRMKIWTINPEQNEDLTDFFA